MYKQKSAIMGIIKSKERRREGEKANQEEDMSVLILCLFITKEIQREQRLQSCPCSPF
jgi:hypothetical protein